MPRPATQRRSRKKEPRKSGARPEMSSITASDMQRNESIPTDKIVRIVVEVAQAMSGFTFYPYQLEISYRLVESLLERDGARITGLFSRQSGKSTSIGGVAASCAVTLPYLAQLPHFKVDPRLNLIDEQGVYRGFANGVNIGVYAPTQGQSDLIFSKMQDTVQTEEAEAIFGEIGLEFNSWNGQEIRVSNNSLIHCGTASDNAKIEGPNYHLLIIDEAQHVSTMKCRKSLYPMCSSHNGTRVLIGTADVQKSEFYHAIKDGLREEAAGGVKNHFFNPYQICTKYNSLYRQFVEQEKKNLGEHSDEFRLAYKCEWLLERGMFTTPEIFIGGERPGCAVTMGRFSKIYRTSQEPCVAGVDFGKTHDSTVVTVLAVDWDSPIVDEVVQTTETMERVQLYHKYILGWLELRGDDYETQGSHIYDYLLGFPDLRKIVLDATGLGAAMFDIISMRFNDRGEDLIVEPFYMNASNKSELFRMYAADVNARRFHFPHGPSARANVEHRKFVLQMLDLVKEYRGGYMDCHAPDEPDAHDDYPDSAALACWAANTPSETQFEVHDKRTFLRGALRG